MKKNKNKVLLVGWDAADWKIINRLIDDGEMPATKHLVENGVIGNLSTLEPPFSPMLWTSIATGKHADKHGVHGFSEPTPDGLGVRPVSSSSRKVKAIWNILTQNDYKTHCINWWPSHPAEPINGVYISNFYPKINSINPVKWPLTPNSVHPKELHAVYEHMRVHPGELSTEHLLPFIPKANLIDFRKDRRWYSISKMIAEASSVQNAATLTLENEEWDFAAIYFDTIDHFCHGFMKYHPPKMAHISSQDFEIYKNAVKGAYKFSDMMLDRVVKIAGDDTTVMLISDHGFHSDHLRPVNVPHEPAGPAYEHRDIGIFCISGPNIKKDETIYGASLLDITPTLLSIFGLPIAEDMDGKPLTGIFESEVKIKTIPSWEDIEGNDGMLPPNKRNEDPVAAQEAMKQLVELGYIEDPGEDMKLAVEKTSDELKYNLARVYLGTERAHLAIPLLEDLSKKDPSKGRYSLRLINCYKNIDELDKAKQLIEKFKESAKKKILSKEELKAIEQRKVPTVLNKKEQEKWIWERKTDPIKKSMQAQNDLTQLIIHEGDILLKNKQAKKALKKYKEVGNELPKKKSFYLQMGLAFIKVKKWKDAAEMFAKTLEYDPESYAGHHGYGVALYFLKDYELSVDHLLTAISLNFYQPLAHFNLGRSLIKMREFESAAQAYEVALNIAPHFGHARNAVIDIYEKHLNQPDKAAFHKNIFEASKQTSKEKDNSALDNIFGIDIEDVVIKPMKEITPNAPITVVSGLPRSGTSMLMQMLDAGGINIYTDNNREADDNNPKGYYEHEKVKNMHRDASWLANACGKGVKIVIPLLYTLPARYNYKIVFMLRDIHEVIESQHRMLVKLGKANADEYPTSIELQFTKYLNRIKPWNEKNYNAELLFVKYSDVLNNPLQEANRINEFLGGNLNVQKMAASVSKDLYRTKL